MVKVYKKRLRISSSKFREILRLFLLDIETIKVSKITHISRQGINRIYKYIRLKNARKCYIRIRRNRIRWELFWRKKKDKRDRGAVGKIPVFGLLKRIPKFRGINRNTFIYI